MTIARIIVVMGVSGAGKSKIGSAVSDRLGVPFIDADDLHPAENRAKMANGQPLDDADRLPWLDAVAAAASRTGGAVVACSALRRSYRDRLLLGVPGIVFVHLEVPRAELERRLLVRAHEFMPASLLDSQLATLEPLADDEPGIRIDANADRDSVVAAAFGALVLAVSRRDDVDRRSGREGTSIHVVSRGESGGGLSDAPLARVATNLRAGDFSTMGVGRVIAPA